MKNEIQLFSFNGQGVRVVMINDEPYFVGKDVAKVLGYQNASKALADHVDDDDKLNNKSLSSLGQREWSASEIGRMLGVSALTIGKWANEMRIKEDPMLARQDSEGFWHYNSHALMAFQDRYDVEMED